MYLSKINVLSVCFFLGAREAGVSKDGDRRGLYKRPSFETPASRAPQDEAAEDACEDHL